MKPQCRANVEQAIGRPLVDGEEQFIDQQIIDQMTTDARENRTKYKALNPAQRIRRAAARAATNLVRNQEVVQWNDAMQDELYAGIKEEFIKAGAKLNPEIMDELEDNAAAMYLDDVIAFSLEHIGDRSVASAIKSLQGVISHELLHWARAVGAFTSEQWSDLTTGAENLPFRRSDAKLIGEEEVWKQLGKNPTYRDYADHVYKGSDDSVRAEEAVAKGIEVEAARHARDMEAGHTVFRKAIGALIKMGRLVVRAIERLATPKQAAIRNYFSAAERAIRQGNVNRQRYGEKGELTPPTRIDKIADVVLENLDEAEVNDLISRLENPLASAAEIADAPIWDSLAQMSNGQTATMEDIDSPEFWDSRSYPVDGKDLTAGQFVSHITSMFADAAGKEGVVLKRRAVIVTGAPGAGKSTVASQIAKKTGSAFIEYDKAAALVPGFNGGLTSQDVTVETRALVGQSMRQFADAGANVVVERIGDDAAAIASSIQHLKDQGYKVDVVHVRSDFSTRMRGSAARFLANGRMIPPADQIRIGNRPTSVHKTVARNNLASGTYEVKLQPNQKGKFYVVSKSGKPNSRVSAAITAAVGGGLARAGQTLSGKRFADPRSYALESAKAFRKWNAEVGPTLGRPMANFGGIHAKGADKTALQLAVQMSKDGVDKNTIRHKTGWFQPLAGGKWRYTLSSGKITLKRKFAEDYVTAWEEDRPIEGDLQDYIDTPVFDAYPSLRKLNTQINPRIIKGAHVEHGNFGRLSTTMGMGRAIGTMNHEQMFAHEIQHLISAIESFEKGGSPHYIEKRIRSGKETKDPPQWAVDEVRWTKDPLGKEVERDFGWVFNRAYAIYLALTDEVSARDAEAMESMTPEQRAAFEPSLMIRETITRDPGSIPTQLDLIKELPLKFWAQFAGSTAVGGGTIYSAIRFLQELIAAGYFSQATHEEIFNLPAVFEAQQQQAAIPEPSNDTPQQFGLTKVQAQRFKDMAERYPPFAAALEKAGMETLPKNITREQFSKLRRAMQDISDLDFLPAQTPLQRKYSSGPMQAARKFQSYARAEKDFLTFLENGVMDGGFANTSKPALKRRVIPAYKGTVIVNPNASDLYQLTKVPPESKDSPWAYEHFRLVKDKDGNVFAGGNEVLHDDIVYAARDAGYPVKGYSPGYGYQDDDHGGEVEVALYVRRKNGPTTTFYESDTKGYAARPIEYFFPNFRPMAAKKPMRTYNAPGGRKGAMSSTTAYGSIPPQPGFLDDVAYVAQQVGAIPYRNVAGVTIQDKRMTKLRPWNIAGGKLDEMDKVAEQLLKKGWGAALRNIPLIGKMIESYFPFGGVPDRVALELLRSLAQGRTSAAQDIARDVASAVSRALKISPVDALRALAGDYSKQQHVADVMEQLRAAMTDPDPTTQSAKIAAITDTKLRQAVVRARNVIDDIGDALVEHGIIHENQRVKHAGHYLRRAYMEHFESYRPAAGVRASGARYRKYREGIPEDRRLSKGEIKDLPFLIYLSIEEPLRDLGLYSYLNSIVHYSATAPSNPGWVLPDSIVMFGGKYRTLFYIAKEKEVNDRSLQQKKNQLLDMGGPKATNAAAMRLVREIAILDNISKTMEAIIKASPHYARALAKGEMPKGYRQLPDDTARFGDMAGAIVMRQLYDDIMGGSKTLSLDEESFGDKAKNFYNAINRNAKFLLTVANPPTHLRNVYSNIMSLARSGTNPLRVLQALYETTDHLTGKKTSPAVAAALKFGAMKQSFTEAELRLMDEFARNVKLQEKRAESQRKKDARTGAMGRASVLINAPLTAMDVASMIAGGVKEGYASGASWMYQMEDVIFKVAKIADEMDRGTPPAVAALEARKHFFDYSAVSEPVRWLRNIAIAPFISYIYFAAPNFIEQAATAPWRLGMTTYLPALGLITLFSILWGYESDEAKKALSEVLESRPMLLPLPWRDEHDRIQWIDLGYMLPEGALVGAMFAGARGDIKSVISSIGFSGGPLVTALVGLQTGVDPFRGTPIYEETDDSVTKSQKGAAFFVRSFMPSMLSYNLPPLPGEDVGGPGYEAWFGTGEDRYGEPTQTESQLVSRMLGINIYPSDVNYGRLKRMRQYNYQIEQIRSDLRRAYIDSRLTPEARQRRIEGLTERMNRAQTDFNDYVNETANAANIESRRASE